MRALGGHTVTEDGWGHEVGAVARVMHRDLSLETREKLGTWQASRSS